MNDRFSESLKKAYSLNQECIHLSNELKALIQHHQPTDKKYGRKPWLTLSDRRHHASSSYNNLDFDQEDESEQIEVQLAKLSFGRVSKDENVFVLRMIEEKDEEHLKRISLPKIDPNRAFFLLPQALSPYSTRKNSFESSSPLSVSSSSPLSSSSLTSSSSSPLFASSSALASISSSLYSSGAQSTNQWRNIFHIKFPESDYSDLKESIDLFELLDAQKEKAFLELKGFVEGLERVQNHLAQQFLQFKKIIELSERPKTFFNDKLSQSISPASFSLHSTRFSQYRSGFGAERVRTREVFLKLKEEEPMVPGLCLEFNLEFTDEKALTELNHFEPLIHRFFEVLKHQDQRIHHIEDIDQEEEEEEEEENEEEEEEEEEIAKQKKCSEFTHFDGSLVLDNEKHKEILVGWLEEAREPQGSDEMDCESRRINTSLLYRGSRDGFESEEFHEKCDSKGSTIVLFQTKEGRRAGGYSPLSWSSTVGYQQDHERRSFLFSLDAVSQRKYELNEDQNANTMNIWRNKMSKLMLGRNVSQSWAGDEAHSSRYALWGEKGYGPTFGLGHDLKISTGANKNLCSYSHPSSYSLPNDQALVGSRYFQILDYEVWRIE